MSEKKELEQEEKKETIDIQTVEDANKNEYEEICFVCHRPESKTGKMVTLPNNIHICSDCMQKAFDTMNSGGFPYGDMMATIRPEDLQNLGNMPGISMINLSDLMGQVPERQKIKKIKAGEPKKAFDIKSIPAPHL